MLCRSYVVLALCCVLSACPSTSVSPGGDDAGLVDAGLVDAGRVVDAGNRNEVDAGNIVVDAGNVSDGGTVVVADAGAYPSLPTLTPEQIAQALPKDAQGRPVLLEVGGTELVVGAARHDAIGAAAACSDLKNNCVGATHDPDRCIATVKRCATSEPRNEAPCCPDACVLAYQEERRLGADPIAANSAVFSSTHECFPGLQAMIRANGGTPRRMPRRAP